MGFDPFAEAANADSRSRGMGGDFKPGYPLLQVDHIQTRMKTANWGEVASYQVRHGKEGKRWLNENVWGIGAFGFDKKSREDQTEMFRNNISSLFKALVVEVSKGEYKDILTYCKENELAQGTTTWGDFADAVSAEASKVGKAGNLYIRVIKKARYEGITEDIVKMAKLKLGKYNTNDYYNGIDGFVLFEEWDKVKGKTPPNKRKPEDFDKMVAYVAQAKSGTVAPKTEGSEGSAGADDAPPAEDDDDIPF